MVDLKNPLTPLKENKILGKEGLSLSKQLSADNMYRTFAYILFILMVVIAFFISLANAGFNWSAIGTAQFWMDFSITFGGGQILKWAFGRFGNAEGHKHPAVVTALSTLEKDHDSIEKRGLVTLLDDFVDYNNLLRKIKAIRKRVFVKLNRKLSNKKRWQEKKKAVQIYEKYLNSVEGSHHNKELAVELDNMNFDIESYKIKYSKINKATLKTGFNGGDSDDDEEQMSFSEMYELFGKSSIITALSFMFTILLAVSSITPEDVSFTTFIVFFTRVTMFALNSYLGYTTGKSAVERVKLNILVNIHKFLKTFLEANNTPKGSLNKIVFPREQTEVIGHA